MTTSEQAAGGDALAPEVFPPTLREVMMRPWWIGMLVVALAVAAIFAWLGQWQLGNAIDSDPVEVGSTETVRPLDDVVQPGEYLAGPLGGQRVTVAGTWVDSDFLVVSSRYNDGVEGFWVTGQFRVAERVEPTALAVALGWAATRAEADAAVAELSTSLVGADPRAIELTGRIIADEGPQLPHRTDSTQMRTMSPAALLGWWSDTEGLNVYRAFLVADFDTVGPMPVPEELVAIDSPAPAEQSPVNWLNIFYAIEWAVFAGFAFYMWFRLARDAWEKEVEALEDDAATADRASAADSR